MFRDVSADWELRGSNKVAPYSRLLEMGLLKSGFELLISRCRSGERVVAVPVAVSCSCRALTLDVDIGNVEPKGRFLVLPRPAASLLGKPDFTS